MKSHHLQETSLRYFLEVVRCGSIREASVRLNVATSAISRQIAGLENMLDTVLFERRPRGMVPSAAGEVLAAHARNSALEAERVVADILALQGLRGGTVRITSAEGMALEFLPRKIAAFRSRYPAIRFHLNVGNATEVSRRVREGEADIGVTFSRVPEKDIFVQYRQRAPVMALVRPGHPLTKFKQVTLAQIAVHPIVLPEGDSTIRQLFDIACSHQRLLIEPVLTSNYYAALDNFILACDAVSITGELSVRYRVADGAMVVIPIRDRGMDGRDIQLQTLVGRTLPIAVGTFLEFLKTEMSEDCRVEKSQM
jgi:DNA-binding transcriptional LysR family regulator